MEDENEVGHRINAKKQRQRVRSGAGLVLGAEERGGGAEERGALGRVAMHLCPAFAVTPRILPQLYSSQLSPVCQHPMPALIFAP